MLAMTALQNLLILDKKRNTNTRRLTHDKDHAFGYNIGTCLAGTLPPPPEVLVFEIGNTTFNTVICYKYIIFIFVFCLSCV